MQVILLEDVKTLGKKGEVVKVSDGYAKNFVIPKKLGVEATQKNLNELKNQQKRDSIVAQQQLDEAKAYGERISKETIQLTMKAERVEEYLDQYPPWKLLQQPSSSSALTLTRRSFSFLNRSNLLEPTRFQLSFTHRLHPQLKYA